MTKSGFLKFLCGFSYALILIGAINWGLIGFFDFNLVEYLFGEMTLLTKIVYILVGLSAILSLVTISACLRED